MTHIIHRIPFAPSKRNSRRWLCASDRVNPLLFPAGSQFHLWEVDLMIALSQMGLLENLCSINTAANHLKGWSLYSDSRRIPAVRIQMHSIEDSSFHLACVDVEIWGGDKTNSSMAGFGGRAFILFKCFKKKRFSRQQRLEAIMA